MELHYRYANASESHVRVWQPSWAGDMFETFTSEDFEKLRELANRLSISFVFHGGDE